MDRISNEGGYTKKLELNYSYNVWVLAICPLSVYFWWVEAGSRIYLFIFGLALAENK